MNHYFKKGENIVAVRLGCTVTSKCPPGYTRIKATKALKHAARWGHISTLRQLVDGRFVPL